VRWIEEAGAMTDVDVGHLLYELCSKLGHCLPEAEQRRLIASPPGNVDAFTDEVLRAEGLDPQLVSGDSRKQARALVDRYFSDAP
jgi:hypothetical protein